ncbi:MAG: excinuclease ABC subunit UvrA [Verrucomicrobiota bacterium]
MTLYSYIEIKGARQHNLKNISLKIPKNHLVVFTGPSGSGKSSLAFDTLFAEGQRRYVQSLSSYARQFLDQMEKPDVDAIEGLSPAVAIEQRGGTGNPRSTVGTATEIYDYLRVLYANCGQPYHPDTGKALQRASIASLVDEILTEAAATRFQILAPMVRNQAGSFRNIMERLKREGFIRVRVDGKTLLLEDKIKLDSAKKHTIEVVIDRLSVSSGIRSRLYEAVELALTMGDGIVVINWIAQDPQTPPGDWIRSNGNFDPETGFHFPRLTPRHFSYNSHTGACPKCHGLGTELMPDPELIIPDPSLTLEEMPIRPWKRGTKMQAALNRQRLNDLARHAGVDMNVPWSELPESFHALVLTGSGQAKIEFTTRRKSETRTSSRTFEGVLDEVARQFDSSNSPLSRKRLSAYLNKHTCRHCNGKRLRREILSVYLDQNPQHQKLNIIEFCQLPIQQALMFIQRYAWPAAQEKAVGEVIREITQRLEFLDAVGLGYLSLTRESSTLSGGEMQRIRLATQIGSGLTGVLYILDEPSIGLHQRDNERLLHTMRKLRDLGNTVVVVEHDEETMQLADRIYDFGPSAGKRGGRIVAEGRPEELKDHSDSITGPYLSGDRYISVPSKRIPVGRGWIRIIGARENNLKSIDAAIPVGCLTCVTGVSGSGKSTLINDILSRALARKLNGAKAAPGAFDHLEGSDLVGRIIQVDQSPIGRSPRSNPATYCGIFDEIRDLFAKLPAAKIRGYQKGRFSFNTPGGRCEVCKGDGSIKLEMQFLPDVFIPCETCKGRRFDQETLEITYKGHNIADVLAMTVHEAMDVFANIPSLVERLETLHRVGLGYLQLGQSGTTLSGGEAQRVKLAAELGKRSPMSTLYLFDEPTTGLHFSDIELLLEVFYSLRTAGHTLVVIEHHMDVIKCADHVIDLGPEGGPRGGEIVAAGTPEAVARNPQSITGQFLIQKLVKSA